MDLACLRVARNVNVMSCARHRDHREKSTSNPHAYTCTHIPYLMHVDTCKYMQIHVDTCGIFATSTHSKHPVKDEHS